MKGKKKIDEATKLKIKEDIEKIKKGLIVDIPEYFLKEKLVIINKVKKTYLLILIGFLLVLTIHIGLIFSKNLLIIVLYSIFAGLFYLVAIIIILLRLFLLGDWERLRNKILIKFNDYIKVHFFRSDKRIITKNVIMNKDGKTFNYNGLYVIDESCIRIDSNGIPNIWYIYGISNPLKFDFMKYLDIYFKNIKMGKPEKNVALGLDVRYSSENLRLMKNDKLLSDMHRDRSQDYNKMVLYMFLLCIVFGIIIFLMFIFLNKPPEVNIVQNVTKV